MKKSAKMSQNRRKQMWFSVMEVLHELALDSKSDDKPSSFDLFDFTWNSDTNVESDADSVVTHASTSTGWCLAPNNCVFTLLSTFQRWWLVRFHSNMVFLTICNGRLCSLPPHTIWKRSVEKHKSYGTLSKTTHFLSVFCEAGVVQ